MASKPVKGMGDDRPAVAGAVEAQGGIDGVEGSADASVAECVDVRLEAEDVDRGDGVRQFGRCPVGDAVGVRAVAVRLEEGGCTGFDDPVGEELHGVGGEQPGGGTLHTTTLGREQGDPFESVLRPQEEAEVRTDAEARGRWSPL